MSIAHLSDLAAVAACPLLVVKVGSSLLVGQGGVRRAWLEGLVAEIAAARAAWQRVIVVSSGAIALGAARLGLDKGGRGSLADAQAAAAVGWRSNVLPWSSGPPAAEGPLAVAGGRGASAWPLERTGGRLL